MSGITRTRRNSRNGKIFAEERCSAGRMAVHLQFPPRAPTIIYRLNTVNAQLFYLFPGPRKRPRLKVRRLDKTKAERDGQTFHSPARRPPSFHLRARLPTYRRQPEEIHPGKLGSEAVLDDARRIIYRRVLQLKSSGAGRVGKVGNFSKSARFYDSRSEKSNILLLPPPAVHSAPRTYLRT